MQDDFEARVVALEKEAKRSPVLYELRLLGLALAGYAYLMALAVGFVWLAYVAADLLTWMGQSWLSSWVVFLVSPAVAFVWVLAVRGAPHTGTKLERDQAPELFKLVEELRTQAGVPKISGIFINGEFNCAMSPRARLGVFGFHQYYFELGLPLMDAIGVEEFKGVLSHELGHVSPQGGYFCLWMNQIRVGWRQLVESMEGMNPLAKWSVGSFARWYVPRFEAFGSVLGREHEYAADRLSARVVGAESLVRGLTAIEVRLYDLQVRLVAPMFEKMGLEPAPPADFFEQTRIQLRETLDPEVVLRVLRSGWRTHKPKDSHPSLAERFIAMQPERRWPDALQEVATAMAVPPAVTASEALLGGVADELRAKLSQDYFLENQRMFRTQYVRAQDDLARNVDWAERLKRNELTAEEAGQVARAVNGKVPADAEMIVAQDLIQRFPEQKDVCFWMGTLLLEENDGIGIDLMEKAIAEQPLYGTPGCVVMERFYANAGAVGEAKICRERGEKYAAGAQKLMKRVDRFSSKDRFERHKMRPGRLMLLGEMLQDEPWVKEAYLVSKIVPELLDGYLHILLVRVAAPKGAGWDSRQVAYDVTFRRICMAQELDGAQVMPWGLALRNLKEARNIEGAKIYERAK